MQIKPDTLLPSSETFSYSPSPAMERLLYHPLSCGHHYYPEGYQNHLRARDCLMILYVIRGSITFKVSCTQKIAFTKECLILNLSSSVILSCSQESESIWIYLKGANSFALYDEIVKRNGNLFSASSSIVIYQQLLALIQTVSHPERATDTLLATQSYRLLCELMNPVLPASADHVNYGKLVQETKKYIATHLSEPLTVKVLAARIHLSPSYFSKIFRQQTGFSPYDYILASRLDRAKELLVNTNDSVIDIAEKTGFNSESNFIYFFTGNVGLSPNKYRKS